MAERLRQEFTATEFIAWPREEVVAERLRRLDETAVRYVMEAPLALKAPPAHRRFVLERIWRDAQRRMLLAGEFPSVELRVVYETLSDSLIPD